MYKKMTNCKKRTVCGKKVKGMDIRFILFRDGTTEKWCHARIDDVGEKELTFRTAPNGDAITVRDEDILMIKTDMVLSNEIKNALYRGMIIDKEEVDERLNRQQEIINFQKTIQQMEKAEQQYVEELQKELEIDSISRPGLMRALELWQKNHKGK